MKEIEASQLVTIILNLTSAVSSLRFRIGRSWQWVGQKTEAVQVLKNAGDDVDKVLSAAQEFVDQLRTDDAV